MSRAIDGDGLDAALTRSYYEAWDDRDAYATSHVGWGMNQIARWDAMTMYDRTQINGTELRAFAGNFLYLDRGERDSRPLHRLPFRFSNAELHRRARRHDRRGQGSVVRRAALSDGRALITFENVRIALVVETSREVWSTG